LEHLLKFVGTFRFWMKCNRNETLYMKTLHTLKISHHVCSLWWQQNVVCVRYKIRSLLVFVLDAGCVMW